MKKKEISWKTDQNGLLQNVRYHDGNIIAFSVAENKCSIRVRDIDGGIADLELSNVSEWNFELQNLPIVNDIAAWKMELVPPNYDGWNTLYGSRMFAKDIEKTVANLKEKKPELFLFHIDCSYGGQMAALCSQIRIFQA